MSFSPFTPLTRLPLALATWALAAAAAQAQSRPGQAVENPQAYHLFRPTPRDAMRPISTDRPDRTESPFTVDAGHFQLEMDAVAWTRDRSEQVRLDGWSLGSFNVKAGLGDRADLQVLASGWSRERAEHPGGLVFTGAAPRETSVRLKANLVGNDGGPAALAFMPFATVVHEPGSRGTVGLILPVALKLPRGWEVGLMGEAHGGGEQLWIGSATASHDLAGTLGGYLELYAARPNRGSTSAVATLDAGLTLGLGPDVQLDGGVNLGLTDATEDLTMFLGLAVRQ